MPFEFSRRIVVDREARARSAYLTVEVEIPAGVGSIEVRMDFHDPDARIDIGCEGPHGWRGWSGGARRRFVIGEKTATWGYVPGELEPGTWFVILGLHVVPDHPVPVDISVRSPAGPVENREEPPVGRAGTPVSQVRSLPSPDDRIWCAGDFHAHTLHSDGTLSTTELARSAADNGLDFLAVTDHNTVSHHAELPRVARRYGLTLLPGQEVTTGRGHANVFGYVPWVDFRRHPDTWLEHAERANGFMSINHPVAGDCSWQWALTRQPSHAEIFHESWASEPTSTSIWSWLNAWGTPAMLGGTDFHDPAQGRKIGDVTTWVLAEENSTDAILHAARVGATTLSVGPTGPVLVPYGDDVIVIDGAGLWLCDSLGRRSVVHNQRETHPRTTAGPHHLETWDRTVLAIMP